MKNVVKLLIGLTTTVMAAGTIGCAPTWVVLDDSHKQVRITDEKVRALNLKYRAGLDRLAASLSAKRVMAPMRDSVTMSYVTFDIFKSQPLPSVYTSILGSYNLQRTSKVSRAASGFSDGIRTILASVHEAGLLEASPDYSAIKLGVVYRVEDFTIHDALVRALAGKQEWAEFVIPTGAAKQYLNQDLSVQELLAQSAVFINGEKNVIKTTDTSID